MDISEVANKKYEAEEKMRQALYKVVADFTKETGMAVSGISVNVVDVTTFNNSLSVVDKVRMDLVFPWEGCE